MRQKKLFDKNINATVTVRLVAFIRSSTAYVYTNVRKIITGIKFRPLGFKPGSRVNEGSNVDVVIKRQVITPQTGLVRDVILLISARISMPSTKHGTKP